MSAGKPGEYTLLVARMTERAEQAEAEIARLRAAEKRHGKNLEDVWVRCDTAERQLAAAREALGMETLGGLESLVGEMLATLSIDANQEHPIGHPEMRRMVEAWKKRRAALAEAPHD